MTRKDSLIPYRVGKLEENQVDNMKKINDLDGKIDTILQTKLPSLELSIKSLETRVNVTAVINVGAVIAGILASKFVL